MKTLVKFYQLFLVSLFLFNCKSEMKPQMTRVNDSRPSNAITYKEMASMFHQYDVGQKPVLDKYRREFTKDPKDTIESVSHFYDINQLKQYIAYLERLSKEKDIKLTGIRIFSAAYPKDYVDKELRGRQTLVFMPTADTKESKNVAFEPLYSKKGEAIPFTEFLNKYNSKDSKKVFRTSFFPFMNDQEDLKSSGTNRLRPTPPL